MQAVLQKIESLPRRILIAELAFHADRSAISIQHYFLQQLEPGPQLQPQPQQRQSNPMP